MPIQLGKFLVVAGVMLIAAGLLFMAGSKSFPFGFGRLPGDIIYKGKNSTFYFPIVSCLVLSVVMTAIAWAISILFRR